MKYFFKIFFSAVALLLCISISSEAQTKFGWGQARSSKGRAVQRQLLKYSGPIFSLGPEFMQWRDLSGVGLDFQGGYRFKNNRHIVGGGILLSANTTRFRNVYLEDNVFNGRTIGDFACPGYRDFNWTYFSMPVYAFGSFDFLPMRISPTASVRAGYNVKAYFKNAPYFQITAGARFALARVNFNPYIGWSLVDTDDFFAKNAINLGISIWFSTKYGRR